MHTLIDLFDVKDLIPHGYCLSWSPLLLWLHVASDLLIALAYYAIPLILVYFIRQRKDLPYPWLVVMFAGFIVACGTTHLLSAITVWIPMYWLDGLLKAFTAIVSVATAMLMIWVVPRVLSVPTIAQLQAEIQQRKTAEGALRESENKLATILDNVEAFIYIKDCNYQYQYVNQPVQQLFGKAVKDIIGKSDDAFFDEATAAKVHEDNRRVIEQGERIATEYVYTNKDNTITHAYFTVNQPLRREDGSIYGLCGISTDISEQKHREQQDKKHLDELAHVTRLGLMGEMASGIAHEVNQPLTAISSYTQVSLNLINTENPDLVKLTEILSKTQQQALRAGRIIHRMREFVKSHSKHRSSADVNALIHEAVGLCIAELKQNDIKLKFELENNLPPVYVDHIQIELVIINLIRNSVEALQNLSAKQQRQLTVNSRLALNNGVRVEVKDNGPGLDQDQRQKILTPFYTTKADGMGMGLSISRSLIEAHNGTLYCNSRPGKGATFYFTLPNYIQRKSGKR
ncbi:ATP-binding protein [Methylobacter sp.]|uniref:PAS domain-containing sensor histidine kinase n=1 Tax=Methylobacter sp. TaxID=2051955 RepID=UPI002488B69D|nr:ATP-binding protein [Methylobacter sp.]MDI1278675.1 ATP-binding protein [Methylobacter sp.]MDI1359495.1 ATP-binding protein [Methylobacter sp.]